MSLQSRLASLIQAVGADVKSINTKVNEKATIVVNQDGTWTATFEDPPLPPVGGGGGT